MTDIVVPDASTMVATVRSAATGDEIAFAQLVGAHHASMARVAYVICGDAESAADVLQSAWTIAWRRLGTLRDPSQVRGWLVAIAANEARKALQRRRRASLVNITAQPEPPADADPIDALDVADLELALRGLRPEDRALLAMRYAAELDSTAIAKELGLTASGVRSRLSRVIERLRTDLAIPPESAT